jgi:hypothetical protein
VKYEVSQGLDAVVEAAAQPRYCSLKKKNLPCASTSSTTLVNYPDYKATTLCKMNVNKINL